MICLLDTHTFVWTLTGKALLSPRAAQTIAEPTNTVLVSSISLYELSFKYHLGKWPEAGLIIKDAEQTLSRMKFDLLAVDAKHAFRAAALPLTHRDPFDRLISAQASLEGAVLISKDSALSQFGVRLLW